MKTLIVISALLMGCAYGNPSDDQEEAYGSTKGPGNDPGNGSSGWNDGSNPNNGLPLGCGWEDVVDNGELIASFVVCNATPGLSYKWLVDPPIDFSNKKDSK